MKKENYILLRNANRVKVLLMLGAMTYDEALNHKAITDYEEMFNREAKQIAKLWGRKFYPFNKAKFLR